MGNHHPTIPHKSREGGKEWVYAGNGIWQIVVHRAGTLPYPPVVIVLVSLKLKYYIVVFVHSALPQFSIAS